MLDGAVHEGRALQDVSAWNTHEAKHYFCKGSPVGNPHSKFQRSRRTHLGNRKVAEVAALCHGTQWLAQLEYS